MRSKNEGLPSAAVRLKMAVAVGTSPPTITKWFKTGGVGMNRALAAAIAAEAKRMGLSLPAKAVA